MTPFIIKYAAHANYSSEDSVWLEPVITIYKIYRYADGDEGLESLYRSDPSWMENDWTPVTDSWLLQHWNTLCLEETLTYAEALEHGIQKLREEHAERELEGRRELEAKISSVAGLI